MIAAILELVDGTKSYGTRRGTRVALDPVTWSGCASRTSLGSAFGKSWITVQLHVASTAARPPAR